MIVYRGMLKVDEVIGSHIYNKALWVSCFGFTGQVSEDDFVPNTGNASQTEELMVTDKKFRSQFLEDRTNRLDPYAPT